MLSNLSHVGFVVFLLREESEVLAYCDGRDFSVLVIMKVYDVRSESMQALVMIACQKSEEGGSNLQGVYWCRPVFRLGLETSQVLARSEGCVSIKN